MKVKQEKRHTSQKEINKEQTGKGITLIALVITIIVLLILVGVSVASLSGNSGLIFQAVNARKQTEEKKENENLQLAVAYALTENLDLTTEIMKNAIENQFGVEKRENLKLDGPWIFEGDIKNYVIYKNGAITTDGVVFVQDKDKITMMDANGEETIIEVGDLILNYNPQEDENGLTISDQTVTSNSADNGYGDQTFNLSSYTGRWRVLGVDEISGQLLITTDDVINTSKGSRYFLKGGQGYVNGIQELDKISKLYGQGKYADTEKTRSINVDDIDRVTGYNPEKTGDGTPCYQGQTYQYGNEVTYWLENGKIKYSVKGEESKESSYSKFQYLNENGEPQNLNEESKTFTSTYYYYYPQSLTTSNSGDAGTVKPRYKSL